jgi:hypothetical protein
MADVEVAAEAMEVAAEAAPGSVRRKRWRTRTACVRVGG